MVLGRMDPDQIRDHLEGAGYEDVTLDSNLAVEVSDQDTPVVVVAPNDEEQVSDILRNSNDWGWRVLPLGAGTHIGEADVPDPIDIAVSSRKLNQIVDYSPADMVVTVQPGLPFSVLKEQLAKHGQMLPVDAVCSKQSTIGGMVAVAASGPLQMHYGTLRDMTVGMRVVYPDGRRITTGSKVVKNVAGYDMTKLFVGSHGTLAFITEISFKLRPLPLHQSLVLARGTAAEAREYVRRIIHSQLVPSRMEALSGQYSFFRGGDETWYVALDCHESRLAGEFQAQTLSTMAEELGMSSVTYAGDQVDEFWNAYHDALRPSTFILRYSVQPANMMTISQRLRQLIHTLGVQVSFSVSVPRGVGRIYAASLSPELEQAVVRDVRKVVEQQGGFAVIENGSVALRLQLDAFGIRRSDFRLMQGIKQTIDPNGTMSPGRLRGVETWDKANLKS